MQVIALVDAPDHVCCRYRVAAFRPWLEEAGHSLELVSLPRSWLQRWFLFRRLHGAAVLLQRQLLPTWQLAQLRDKARLLLFDFDDAVFLRDSYAPRGFHHPRKMGRFVATMAAADAVIAGNSFLAEHAAGYGSADRVHIIPTCVDEARCRPTSRGHSDGKQLVWVGSSSTLKGLERIAPMLEQLGRAIPGLRLKVICDRFPVFEHLQVIPCPWSEATESKEIATADVGVTWIPDDPWSRGKCGLKLLQYMAAGLPVIANPVGVHPEMVRHGETGYLATTGAEWIDAVHRLTSDQEARRRMGRAGRARLEADYSVRTGAQRWLDLLARLERSPSAQAG